MGRGRGENDRDRANKPLSRPRPIRVLLLQRSRSMKKRSPSDVDRRRGNGRSREQIAGRRTGSSYAARGNGGASSRAPVHFSRLEFIIEPAKVKFVSHGPFMRQTRDEVDAYLASSGTRYRVCDRSSGSDGWLAAEELRTTTSRPTSVDDVPPSGTHPQGRRFGSPW